MPCQRWLSTKEDDGQISRDLVPVDPSLKNKLTRQDSKVIRKEIALETKGMQPANDTLNCDYLVTSLYHVYCYCSNKWYDQSLDTGLSFKGQLNTVYVFWAKN